MSTFVIKKTIKWHMAHRVPHHKSKCKSNHGHTYFLTAEVEGYLNADYGSSEEGMVMDFGDIKDILMEEIYNKLDHGSMFWEKDPLVPALQADANTKLIIVDFIPTAENIAAWCFEKVEKLINMPGARRLLSIEIHETPTSVAIYHSPNKMRIRPFELDMDRKGTESNEVEE